METGLFDTQVIPMKEKIFRLAKSMLSDASEAEDTTQDVLEKLWEKRDKIAAVDNVEAYVFVITRNQCLDRIRRRKIRNYGTAEVTAEKYGSMDNNPAIELNDMRAIVVNLISQLPDKQRTVINLRDMEECEFAEITQITGIAEPTARVLLSRARKTVREKLVKLIDHGV